MCYDTTNHIIVEGEGCISKVIGISKELIVEPSIETRVGAIVEEHGREGIEAHNS